jgi:hypothetical protein
MFNYRKTRVERFITLDAARDGCTYDEARQRLSKAGFALNKRSWEMVLKYQLPLLQKDPSLLEEFIYHPPTFARLRELAA